MLFAKLDDFSQKNKRHPCMHKSNVSTWGLSGSRPCGVLTSWWLRFVSCSCAEKHNDHSMLSRFDACQCGNIFTTSNCWEWRLGENRTDRHEWDKLIFGGLRAQEWEQTLERYDLQPLLFLFSKWCLGLAKCQDRRTQLANNYTHIIIIIWKVPRLDETRRSRTQRKIEREEKEREGKDRETVRQWTNTERRLARETDKSIQPIIQGYF